MVAPIKIMKQAIDYSKKIGVRKLVKKLTRLCGCRLHHTKHQLPVLNKTVINAV
jgi:hypothetical protein